MDRHATDAVSLAFGAIFIAIAALFLSGVDAFDFVTVWALPGAFVATGLVLGALAVTRYRRVGNRGDAEPDR